MQKQSKPFSFRGTFREVFSPSAKHDEPICECWSASILSSLAYPDWHGSAAGVDPVSSGTISGRSDVAMSVVETSLAALQTGSALVTSVPFIAPVAGLILQALQMRGVRFRLLSLYVLGFNDNV